MRKHHRPRDRRAHLGALKNLFNEQTKQTEDEEKQSRPEKESVKKSQFFDLAHSELVAKYGDFLKGIEGISFEDPEPTPESVRALDLKVFCNQHVN